MRRRVSDRANASMYETPPVSGPTPCEVVVVPAGGRGGNRWRHGRLGGRPMAHEDVPENRERHHRDGRRNEGGESTLHTRNMSKRAARPLALPLRRLYDCGPVMPSPE